MNILRKAAVITWGQGHSHWFRMKGGARQLYWDCLRHIQRAYVSPGESWGHNLQSIISLSKCHLATDELIPKLPSTLLAAFVEMAKENIFGQTLWRHWKTMALLDEAKIKNTITNFTFLPGTCFFSKSCYKLEEIWMSISSTVATEDNTYIILSPRNLLNNPRRQGAMVHLT